ncbi:zinc carboxypeptidase [Streptomyces puniciscabiei]|uniref:Zinc carboxypeptidase n=1 Tax=Streptomyces puniciscabiei TaxID=164348 RepID=A0A542THS3_9ACTN|nr:M14 family zinc carboxypeptidase [Streptomyces puniciscabiei]TQK86267.1 zinc carboxypeptidase [Streptomyces puniciscabiei]
MAYKRLAGLTAGAVIVATALLPQVALAGTGADATAGRATTTGRPHGGHRTVVVYRVPTRHPLADAERLTDSGYDLLEKRDGNSLFVSGDASTAAGLRRLGFTPAIASTLTEAIPSPAAVTRAAAGDTFDGGYHTVTAQYSHMDNTGSQHPDLAKVVTYGQSWLKQHGRGGRDLKAICITKMQAGDCALSPNSAKPRFFLMSQIHARELTTGEMSWRWIDALTGNYGKDPAITKLMDTTEMWVVPDANPDGVDMVAAGGDNPVLQRKNADDSHGSRCGVSAYSQIGVDLNRNTGSHWHTSGTSSAACDQTYGGPAANSEVENTALESLFRELFPAVRTGTGDTAPAPSNAKGMMITLHSDASMVLFPWEYDASVHTGNDTALRALAAHMASLTGYQYGQAGEILYNASGGTDDWTYDKLGLASFTIEIGDSDGVGCDGFTPPFSCQDSYFWPKIEPALLYAAQHAAAPYTTTSDARR